MSKSISFNYNNAEFFVPNDSEFISNICRYLPENSAPDLLLALASHRSTQVQCAVASRDDLSVEAIRVLISGGNRQVRRTLVYADAFKSVAQTDMLLEWCEADEEFAAQVARQVMDFENADPEELFAALSTHSDPDVRRELAQTWQLPKSLRKKLFDDSDFGVARAAKNSR